MVSFEFFPSIFSHAAVHTFVDYVNKQNGDFRPKANDLSKKLDEHLETQIAEWKNLATKIND